jgi:hypothetical protein
VLLQDITFDTSSEAGVFVTGYSVGSMEIWKDAHGVSLQKILSKLPDTSTDIESTSQSNSISFRVFEQQFTVDSYVELYFKFLEEMSIKHPIEVDLLEHSLELNVNGVSLFSVIYDEQYFAVFPHKRKISEDVWAGIIDDKNIILSNIVKILTFCGCSQNQFEIL